MSHGSVNFRSTPGWQDTGPNLQRNSYDYGYGGGRTDLPAIGYNPVYPSISDWTPSAYTPTPIASQRPNREINTYSYQASFQEYNPERPEYQSYDRRHEADPRPVTIVKVNQSAFSVSNTIKKRQRSTHNVVQVPSLDSSPVNRNVNQNSAESAIANTASSIMKTNTNTSSFQMKRSYSNVAQRGRGGSRSGGYFGLNGRGGVHKQFFPTWGNPPMSNGRGGWSGGRVPRPYNKQNDIPLETMPDGTETITLVMDPENLLCFHGPSSVFTTQHQFPVLVDGNIYESVDHYYQYKKVKDLCGIPSEKITEMVRDTRGRRLDRKTGFREEKMPYSQIAREQLKLNSVDKKKVEEWRCTKGLKAVQDALLAKVSQSGLLREALKESNGKILVHSYVGDSIYGTGATVAQVKKWCEGLKKNGNTSFAIPATFPLTEETVKMVPNFSKGRNILGVILMQLRDMLSNGNINVMDMTAIFESIKNGGNLDDILLDDLEITDSSFAIGGGNLQAKLAGALPEIIWSKEYSIVGAPLVKDILFLRRAYLIWKQVEGQVFRDIVEKEAEERERMADDLSSNVKTALSLLEREKEEWEKKKSAMGEESVEIERLKGSLEEAKEQIAKEKEEVERMKNHLEQAMAELKEAKKKEEDEQDKMEEEMVKREAGKKEIVAMWKLMEEERVMFIIDMNKKKEEEIRRRKDLEKAVEEFESERWNEKRSWMEMKWGFKLGSEEYKTDEKQKIYECLKENNGSSMEHNGDETEC